VRIPRTTLKGLLAVVLLIAFEASVLELTGGAGVLLIGLALAAGVVRWWQAEDKHFWAGFNAAGVLAVIVFCNYVDAGIALGILPGTFFLIHLLPWRFPDASLFLIERIVIPEASYGLPMLLIATIGGLAATLLPRRTAAARTRPVRFTIYGLLAATAVLALIAWQERAYFLSHVPPPLIRVYNKTNIPLDHVQLHYEDLEPHEPPATPLVDGTLASPGVLEPGGTVTWQQEFFDHTGLTFSGKAPDGTLRTGGAEFDVKNNPPASLHFYVEPSGVRVRSVQRPWWLR
jgi:hypothetical protein